MCPDAKAGLGKNPSKSGIVSLPRRLRVSANIRNVEPLFIGSGEEARVIASIGVSSPEDDVDTELEKARQAIRHGASVIIDHSLLPSALEIQRRVAAEIPIPLSVIPVYNVAAKAKDGGRGFFTRADILKTIEEQAKIGADMLTLHASVVKDDVAAIKKSKRLIPCTSRGGTIVLENMLLSGEENPFWVAYDDILAIAKTYALTLSLGAVFRPASVADFVEHDTLFWTEVERHALLVERAVAAGVPIMVEGIGHAPIDRIPEIVKKSKTMCHEAPYRVLSVATDAALGFDHVSSAIASAVAVANGADVVTAVTRAEHIGLPSLEDVVEAVVSARIAAHSGDLARLRNFEKDIAMSRARRRTGCRGLVDAAICPHVAAERLRSSRLSDVAKKCTMCGDFCALSALDRIQEHGDDDHRVEV